MHLLKSMWYYFQFIEEKVELKKANELTNFTKLGKKKSR